MILTDVVWSDNIGLADTTCLTATMCPDALRWMRSCFPDGATSFVAGFFWPNMPTTVCSLAAIDVFEEDYGGAAKPFYFHFPDDDTAVPFIAGLRLRGFHMERGAPK